MPAQFAIPSFNDLLTQAIQDYQAIATTQGFTVSPDPNSEVYARLSTFTAGLSVLYFLGNQIIQSNIVDTATGIYLDALANVRNIYRKSATSSQGNVIFASTSSQTIVAGSKLSGPNGLLYAVSTTGVYGNNQMIPVISVDVGSNTNLSIGDSALTWIDLPFNSQPTAVIGTIITGGVDQENDNSLRARVIANIQYPPQAGNSSQLSGVASGVDAFIQQAFIYKNFNGLGSLLVVLVGNQTSNYIGRDIPHLALDNIASLSPTVAQDGLILDGTTQTPYNQYAYISYNPSTPTSNVLKIKGTNLSNDTSIIYGQFPITIANQYATAVTTVNNLPADFTAAVSLPYPIGAPNQGVGGGWNNFTTFPNPDGYSVFNFCAITVVNSPIHLVVQAPSASRGKNVPQNGVSQVSWNNRCQAQNNGWTVITATVVTAVDNMNDTWTLTLDTPLVFPPNADGSPGKDFYGNTGVIVGDYLYPASANGQNHLNTIMQSFANLGPGEVTTSTGLQSLGADRFPASSLQYPQIINTLFTDNLEVNNQDVFSAAILYDSTSGNLPAPNAPPNIFIPRNIGFYDINQTQGS